MAVINSNNIIRAKTTIGMILIITFGRKLFISSKRITRRPINIPTEKIIVLNLLFIGLLSLYNYIILVEIEVAINKITFEYVAEER
jgi:hypothetical protein